MARILRTRAAVAAALCLAGLALAAAAARADVSSVYPDVVFGDGFESGSANAWSPALGTGSATVSAAAAHAGSFGLRLANGVGQYTLVAKTLPSAVTDSSTSFWLRTSATSGIVTVAQARDGSSAGRLWDLVYDAGARAFDLFPYKSAGSVEITTGANAVAAANTWVQIEVRYNAATDGGARLYVDGQTQASWGVTGDFSHSSDYRILQLWNDGGSVSFDFDDVTVARPSQAPTAPDAPTGVSAQAGDGAATLTWTTPANTGGSPITSYRITPHAGATTLTPVDTGSATAGAQVTGLTNGTAYTFTVAATNAVGTGADSAASAPVTPRAGAAAPGAPTAVTGHAGDGSVALTWTAPSDGGGAAISSYRITPYTGTTAQTAVDTGSASTSATVPGLTNGTAYTFKVAARNSAGTGPDSGASDPVTPTASAYTDAVFSDDFESGSLSAWTQTLGTGSAAAAAAAADHGVYGLRLANAAGQATLEAKTLSRTVDDSSTRFSFRTSATSGFVAVAEARDSASSGHMWTLLYAAGSHAFLFYPYTATGSVAIDTGAGSAPGANTWMDLEVRYDAASGGAAQLFIDGRTQAAWGTTADLTHSDGYRILQLWNDGSGVTSDFDDVTVASRPASTSAPGAPGAVTGTAGDGSVALDWTAPASDGGSPVTGYRITPFVGGAAQTSVDTGSTSTSRTITGLTNGTAYTFTVAATNAVGTGPASTPSGSVTPRAAPTAPGAPTGVAGTAGDASAALHWTAPADDGNSATTGYRITPFVGTTAQTPVDTGSTSTSRTITGLTNGTAYTFKVAATNSVGTGAQSAASDPVTPAAPAVPGAPGRPTGGAGDKSVALAWTAPASDGGSAITGYRITPFAGAAAQTPIDTGSTSTTRTISGLTDGTAYTFTVAATNAVGTGPASPASAAVTPQAAKTIVSIEFDDGIETQFQTLAMLQAHGMHGTYFVNSGLTTEDVGWRMSWPQLGQIAAAGNEIAGHSWDHADLTTLSTADQQHEICDDRTNIQSHGLPLPTDFAYPYGAYEQNNVPAMVEQCGYSSAREVGGVQSDICPTGCPFAETLPPANPFVTRTAPDIRIDTTLAMVEGYVTQAEQHGGGWVQLVFHDMCSTDCTGDDYSTTPAMLGQFLDWLQPRAANGTVTETVNQALGG